MTTSCLTMQEEAGMIPAPISALILGSRRRASICARLSMHLSDKYSAPPSHVSELVESVFEEIAADARVPDHLAAFDPAPRAGAVAIRGRRRFDVELDRDGSAPEPEPEPESKSDPGG